MAKTTPTVSRVRAARREANREPPPRVGAGDSFQNFLSKVGLGTENQSSYGGYGFNPITRSRILLDFAYRGSWLVRACVDAIPEDMTREGIEYTTGIQQDDKGKLTTFLQQKLQFWTTICTAMKWARLYGGAGIFIVVSGQKASEPLRIETVGRGQLLRLVVLDRWMLNPSINSVVTDPEDPDCGHPEYYDVVADAPIAARQRIHHSRFIRFEGLDIPYYQRLSENFWTLSILEPLYDRITAFDSASLGVAQLVYKAHLRTYKIKGLRQIIAGGGKLYESLIQQMHMIRQFQTNEGLTLMDAEDEFEAHQYTFAGLPEVIVQFAQQVAGAEQMPLVRLFGQSPAGLNATGDSDWRNYYDGIKRRQEERLRNPVHRLLLVACKSLEIKVEDDFNFEFVPLWQLDHVQRAAVSQQVTQTVQTAWDGGLLPNLGVALRELKQSSEYTGIWTNITDEDIEAAKDELPPSQQMPDMGGLEGPPQPEMLPTGPSGGETGNEPTPFLPGLEPDAGDSTDAEFDDFLPGSADRPIRNFLPDSGGAFEGGETERRDWRKKKPLYIVHVNDQNLSGRETQFAGFPVVVEVEKGQPRFEGSSGGAVMAAPYGYFPGYTGLDGDDVDVFLGENTNATSVYVINQCDAEDRNKLVQHKVFLGFDNPIEVTDVFTKFYADGNGGRRLQRGYAMTVPEFRTWLEKYRQKAA